MPYSTDIPGQVSIFQLRAIELVASLIPEYGHAVEVGSLFGSSSYAWGMSCHPSVTVHCIDPWERNQGIRAMEERFNIKYGIEQFLEYTKDVPTIKAHKGYSPNDFEDWYQPIDLYYEDAVHTDPILTKNVEFWTSHLKPNGILCGDDYRPRFPDVIRTAKDAEKRLNRELITVEHFWCLLPSEDECPGAGKVAEALKALSTEAREAHEKRGLMLRIGPNGPVTSPKKGEPLTVKGRIYIDSLAPWPTNPTGPLKAGIRVTTEDEPENEVLVAIATLPTNQLLYDKPINFECEVPKGVLPDEMYRTVFDVYSDKLGWLLHSRTDKARAPLVRIGEIKEANFSKYKTPNNNPNKVYPNEVLSFGIDGKARTFTTDGWIDPEKQHSWTYAGTSQMDLIPDSRSFKKASTYMLYLDVNPFLVKKKVRHQSLEVLINGEVRASLKLTGPDRVAIKLTKQDILRNKSLNIEFRHPDFKRPKDYIETSNDRKPIAFAFQRMTILPLYES